LGYAAPCHRRQIIPPDVLCAGSIRGDVHCLGFFFFGSAGDGAYQPTRVRLNNSSEDLAESAEDQGEFKAHRKAFERGEMPRASGPHEK
jgi:hypothetical protein